MDKKLVAKIVAGVSATFIVCVIAMGIYTVDEGHVGVVKSWGKAVKQVGPGIHLKLPVRDKVSMIEVRQRRNVEELAAATANQLRITAKVSVNWTVNTDSAMDLFVKYGGLSQFETRVLDPKLRSAAKAALSKFPADQLIRNRGAAVAEIMATMSDALAGFPITVNSPQIENIVLPGAYNEAVLAKEKARENAEQEKHRLTRQKLVAQQKVQTAEAERDARKAAADGEAYAKRTLADAEGYRIKTEYTLRAEGVATLRKELTKDYNDYIRAQKWDGRLPTHVLGTSSSVLLGSK
jgi:regulator of protease activity HflC (stomatin/prohibitin superfamily)